MTPAHLPANEAERLAALRNYAMLDTAAEDEFDDITLLASQICGAPVALLSLVDAERQWFKSKIGMTASEGPRDQAFCAHTILGRDLLEIPNVLDDERFRDNPIATGEAGIRFYAGAPLITPEGFGIGSLCVMDRLPRRLTPHQRAVLQMLARQVFHVLELRRATHHIREMNANLERLVNERTAALQISEERFQQLAERSSEVFWFLGLNPERYEYMSPAVEKIWGRPAAWYYVNPEACMAAIHPDDVARFTEAWENCVEGRSPRFDAEYRIVRPDGSVRWVLDSGTPIRNEAGDIIRMSGVAKDITERKMSERQILRAQRLESIGTLAGGVAHDLNNALAPILMGIALLRGQNPESDSLINTMETSARHGADMVRQLLTFAKGAEGERLTIKPLHLLKDMEKIIKGTFPKNIQLQTAYAKRLSTVSGDATQLHQVLLNLCVNARDAMPHGGILTLEAADLELDAAHASSIPDALPGRYVVWRIKDTGLGIPPEIMERIFEPFFSTKDPEKGTGLGLSTVMGIVKSHGGFIQVHSVPSEGSTFSVYLPAASPPLGDTSFFTKAEMRLRGNGEVILVVDDEPGIREMMRSVLTSLNFKVLTAADGTAALIHVAEKRDELRLVIADLHMPHMDGLSFVRVLKHMLPKVGVVVASGRLDERAANEFKALGGRALLDKPFTQEKLVETLKTCFAEKT